MFVDNPVGTGYSYVDSYSDLTVDNAQIASDLVVLVKEAFKVNPDMEKMPFYVYAESYGGKMTVDFALAFDQVRGFVFLNFHKIIKFNCTLSTTVLCIFYTEH